MPLTSKGKFFVTYNNNKNKNATYRIYIPAMLVKDSQFPFKVGSVNITIEGETLVITQEKEEDVQFGECKEART